MASFVALYRLLFSFSFVPLTMLLLLLRLKLGDGKQATSCDFNQLCVCQNYTSQYIDVTCINVPLESVPTFDGRYRNLYRIRLIGVPELTQLYDDSFSHLTTLASLTVSKSRLWRVNSTIFARAAIRKTLSTVELSYGKLIEIPVGALSHLHQLQWLSLKGNQIEIIRGKELSGLQSVRTLLLNENWLSIVEDRAFQSLSSLELIDFDGNMIERVEGTPFPPSLKSLSVSNCLLRKIPFGSLQNLVRLEVLQLRKNLISHLSPFKLAVQRMELIDLSHNLISNLPNDLFANFNQIASTATATTRHSKWAHSNGNETGTLEIQKFHLDFNFIHSIPPELFRAVQIEKLTLSSNRISSALIAANAFVGPLESGLKVLDLNYNLIDKYPTALKPLRALRNLFLKNNRIKQIDEDAFVASALTLETLDLSQNVLERMPHEAFGVLRQIIKVNLHDNLIDKLDREDLNGWCSSLKSLTLSKNNLENIEKDTFKPCTQLTELRLGGNKFLQLNIHALSSQLQHVRLLDLSSLSAMQRALSVQKTLDKPFPLSEVKWLQFDFNSLSEIPSGMSKTFPSLMYLDLQNNQIEQLSSSELNQLINLTTVILSHNNLSKISSGTFNKLNKLESVVLYFNRIKTVQSKAFDGLSKLHSLVLSRNQISKIERDAFFNLSTDSIALTLMLDQNRLRCLSSDSLAHVVADSATKHGDFDFAIYLNVSHNQIETFANCGPVHSIQGRKKTKNYNDDDDADVNVDDADEGSTDNRHNEGHDESRTAAATRSQRNQRKQTLPIRVLDLSFNRVSTLTGHFFRTFCTQALSLLANNNLIRLLPTDWMWQCPRLQTLSFNYNHISEVAKTAPPRHDGHRELIMGRWVNSSATTEQVATPQIQTLSLRYNAIKSLTSFEFVLTRLEHLKWLDLTGNQIDEIPGNLFSRTALIKLNLAHNRLSFDDKQNDDECFGIGASLKYLDLAHNALQSLPPRIDSCHNLIELLLSHNRIYSFNYINPLARSLSKLQRLELFQNPVDSSRHSTSRVVTFAFLNNHSMLSSLNLNRLDIEHLDELNVPYLYRLELSGNSISTINSKVLSRCRNLRWLNLSFNNFQNVPKHIWKYVTRLRHLDLRANPIEVLDSSSFAGLKYLKHLDIRGLKLQYIDSRIFLYQSQMSTLQISTYPATRSFRLQDILSKSDALKTVQIEVKESILSHQIQWAFGGKLRELIITGKNLMHIVPDAFQGLNNANDLTLRITNTSIRNLPEGLLKYLADIRYIAIDLRGNQLQTVSPGVFFSQPTSKNTKTWQSRQLLGGIILEDNPLQCDCNLLWISKWMKQIFTEMKGINIDAAIQVKASLALSYCKLIGTRHSIAPVTEVVNGNDSGSAVAYRSEQIPIIHLTEEHIGDMCTHASNNHTGNSFTFIDYRLFAIILTLNTLCYHVMCTT